MVLTLPSIGLDEAMTQVVRQVQRSLVVVENERGGAGAGVVWRAGGYVVTNHHVIAAGRPYGRPSGRRHGRAQEPLQVTLPDGRQPAARLIAEAPHLDLALFQIDASDVATAQIADSQGMRVGQLVFAVGHPWGQRGFVTAGVISSLGTAQTSNGRKPGSAGLVPIIRSDVLLQPGNSGGPLVDAAGGVLGINTLIIGGDQGVAIPSHVVDEFVSQVLSGPEADRRASTTGRANGAWM